ncbi:hypothetical protein ASPVEDRAFT_86542 [Aspergillus versicolor CBS 583.65]|uniref:Uncharacterized protein n=1 Tax=Aspergillus versicolor CBS 583.65 TaxID=1036611 RepID=A0A1L9PUG5_ASPVE|nr:uncharacterized protein ASPVEDRAFT_86542 [Aspergillus versicolor CBS 583.65]OJJ05177.1 hypothetical protein ASPVEDRAFT_86542 [Aspergillus versicolor CBS 583.65]
MKLSFIAALAVLGTAVAVPAGPTTQLKPGAECKKDGSLGICPTKVCVQKPDQKVGHCE